MNELQMAYYNSCAMQTSNQVCIPDGLFAVIWETNAYCPVTDATLPNPARHVVSVHGSKRVAEHIARKMREKASEQEDYESDFVVFPRPPRPLHRPTPVTLIDDEIPF